MTKAQVRTKLRKIVKQLRKIAKIEKEIDYHNNDDLTDTISFIFGSLENTINNIDDAIESY